MPELGASGTNAEWSIEGKALRGAPGVFWMQYSTKYLGPTPPKSIKIFDLEIFALAIGPRDQEVGPGSPPLICDFML